MNLAIIGFSIADSDTPMFLRILYNVFFIFSGTFVIRISQFSEVSFFLLSLLIGCEFNLIPFKKEIILRTNK